MVENIKAGDLEMMGKGQKMVIRGKKAGPLEKDRSWREVVKKKTTKENERVKNRKKEAEKERMMEDGGGEQTRGLHVLSISPALPLVFVLYEQMNLAGSDKVVIKNNINGSRFVVSSSAREDKWKERWKKKKGKGHVKSGEEL